MICAPVTITLQRENVSDFVTHPFYIEHATIMYKKPKENNYVVFTRPFKPEVWYSVIGAFLGVILIGWLTVLYVQQNYKLAAIYQGVMESSLITYKTFLNQGKFG